jgi:hypothetical protein
MRENTPPHSPYNEEDDDEELVYVGDDIDEVIEHLEATGNDEEMSEDGKYYFIKI